MIILDLHQVIISNIMAQVGTHTNVPIEENLIRHMVLNQIRMLLVKNRPIYGSDLVIATDGRHYWRKDVFPFYKANRAKQRKASDFDWQALFDCLGKLRQELTEFMPYPVINHDKAEADDVIGTIVTKYGVQLCNNSTKRILIVSGDGDFAQLQRFANVDQYDPIRNNWIKPIDASKYLREHIIRGDVGDGVPNILSADDCLVTGVRQKRCTQKVLETWLPLDEELVEDPNYKRNRQLIDLTQIPQWLQDDIITIFESQKTKTRDKMFNYFVQARLKNLLANIQEF